MYGIDVLGEVAFNGYPTATIGLDPFPFNITLVSTKNKPTGWAISHVARPIAW